MEKVREDVVDAKNHFGRQFQQFTANFYVMKSALRYFSVKQGMSFTSSKISDSFPVNTPVAGACLKILDAMDVVQPRTRSSSPDLYMPSSVDMERLSQIQEILLENREIEEFSGKSLN